MITKLTIVKTIILLFIFMVLLAGVVQAQGEGVTVAGGLNGPMGVVVAPDGSVWVVDSGIGGETDLPFTNPQTGELMTAKFGESSQIVQIAPDGTQTTAANLPSVDTGMDIIGGARLVLLNDTLYVTSGQWLGDSSSNPSEPNMAAVAKVENGQVTEVSNTWTFEKAQNPDGYILDSHPYGITAGPDGNLWVADAAANDLLKIDPATGDIEVVAVFAGVPSPLPNPGRGDVMESDPVPTGVAVDQSGNIFVSLLPGFPFLPGSAKVVQVTPDGQVSDYATGLTTLTDLVAGPDGNLYAVQFAEFTEQGPTPNSGRVIRVKQGSASEVVLDGLSFPTAIAFNEDGNAYVTINGVGAPGSGEVMMYAGLTNLAGSPLPVSAPPPANQAAGEAPATLPQSGGALSLSNWNAAILTVLGIGLIGFGFLLRGINPERKS